MQAKLLIDDVSVFESEFALGSFPITLGRGENADIQISDRWASRVNCEIDQVDGELVVRDLQSSNGTLVNGEHVSECRLERGDKITIGMSTFILEFDGPETKLSASPSTVQRSGKAVTEDPGATLIGRHPSDQQSSAKPNKKNNSV